MLWAPLRSASSALPCESTAPSALPSPSSRTGIAHRAVGLPEPVLAIAVLALLVALLPLALLALLTLLALFAALALLALPHAALGEFLLQFLQPVAQTLLVLLQVAHALLVLTCHARGRAANPGPA